MRAKNTALPSSPVDIYVAGGKATLTLWDGTYTVTTGAEGETIYEYDIYQLTVPSRPGLVESVGAAFEEWYAAAQAAEAAADIERETKQYEKSLACSIPDVLLDYDFRLMMLEELGEV